MRRLLNDNILQPKTPPNGDKNKFIPIPTIRPLSPGGSSPRLPLNGGRAQPGGVNPQFSPFFSHQLGCLPAPSLYPRPLWQNQLLEKDSAL